MRDVLSENVAGRFGKPPTNARRAKPSLYGEGTGDRKYLNAQERSRALHAALALPTDQKLFAFTLAWTGARPSEVLALRATSFQIEPHTVAIRTLKRRRHSIREVPIPPWLMTELDRHFELRAAQREHVGADRPLWPWCRQTAWRLIKRLMNEAGVNGRRASPRGLRHAFGVGTLQAGVPINLLQRWLGHASIETTAIYADASGPEEAALAARFWRLSDWTLRSAQLTQR